MMAKKKDAPDLDSFLGMLSQLAGESDRGVALIMTAWLDDALDGYLRTRVIQEKKLIEDLFAQDRPLSTFSARINVAYAFAHISSDLYHDLHVIREIRNRFAHERTQFTFETQEIADRCKNLQLIQNHNAKETDERKRVHTRRDEFLLTALMYAAYFISRTDDPTGKVTFWGNDEEVMLIHDVLPKLLESMLKKYGQATPSGVPK
jgi:DNA-binding MltR family transcriptional regulator